MSRRNGLISLSTRTFELSQLLATSANSISCPLRNKIYTTKEAFSFGLVRVSWLRFLEICWFATLSYTIRHTHLSTLLLPPQLFLRDHKTPCLNRGPWFRMSCNSKPESSSLRIELRAPSHIFCICFAWSCVSLLSHASDLLGGKPLVPILLRTGKTGRWCFRFLPRA